MDDWVDRERWEPFIWEQVKANDDGKDLLKLLQLAKEEALCLMQTILLLLFCFSTYSQYKV